MKEVLLDAKKLLETNTSAPHPDEVSALPGILLARTCA
jgi:hypothetical protein